jgi:hypothetical protein
LGMLEQRRLMSNGRFMPPSGLSNGTSPLEYHVRKWAYA